MKDTKLNVWFLRDKHEETTTQMTQCGLKINWSKSFMHSARRRDVERLLNPIVGPDSHCAVTGLVPLANG